MEWIENFCQQKTFLTIEHFFDNGKYLWKMSFIKEKPFFVENFLDLRELP